MKLPWKSYNIKARESQGVSILDVSGGITRGKAPQALRERVNQLLAANKRTILLNLKEIRRIDNHGIAALLAAYSSAQQQGGELRLVNPSKEVQQRLDDILLTVFLDVYGDEAEALANCLPPSADEV